MLDKMAVKKKLLEQLLEHMDESQGQDMHEMVMAKKKPLAVESVEVEVEPKKPMPGEEADKKESLAEMIKKVEDGEDDDDMSDDELEEMLKGLA